MVDWVHYRIRMAFNNEDQYDSWGKEKISDYGKDWKQFDTEFEGDKIIIRKLPQDETTPTFFEMIAYDYHEDEWKDNARPRALTTVDLLKEVKPDRCMLSDENMWHWQGYIIMPQADGGMLLRSDVITVGIVRKILEEWDAEFPDGDYDGELLMTWDGTPEGFLACIQKLNRYKKLIAFMEAQIEVAGMAAFELYRKMEALKCPTTR